MRPLQIAEARRSCAGIPGSRHRHPGGVRVTCRWADTSSVPCIRGWPDRHSGHSGGPMTEGRSGMNGIRRVVLLCLISVEMGEPAPFGAWLRSLVHRAPPGRAGGSGVGRRAARCAGWRHHARSSHQSATSAPAASSSSASGMTARASAAARAEITWLPCPPARLDPDAAVRVADRRARVVALGLDAQERPTAMALRDGLAEDRAIDRAKEVEPARERADGRTHEQLERDRRRHRVAGQAEQEDRTRRRPGARRRRTRTACRAGRRRARGRSARSARWRS